MDKNLLWIRKFITSRDKFSEDLDFDCKMLPKQEFIEMTDSILQPDYSFLSFKYGINNSSELKTAIAEILAKIDLKQKSKDFEHLLFMRGNSQRILSFEEFIKQID